MPGGYLLDTNVISETVRPRPNERVLAWLARHAPERYFISLFTIGELRKGVWMARRESRSREIADWIEKVVLRQFAGRILPLDGDVVDIWARIAGRAELAGKRRPVIDTLLAATAMHHDLVFATRNVADVEGTGVRLTNPWD